MGIRTEGSQAKSVTAIRMAASAAADAAGVGDGVDGSLEASLTASAAATAAAAAAAGAENAAMGRPPRGAPDPSKPPEDLFGPGAG